MLCIQSADRLHFLKRMIFICDTHLMYYFVGIAVLKITILKHFPVMTRRNAWTKLNWTKPVHRATDKC